MRTTLIALPPGSSISEAIEFPDAHHISMLPPACNPSSLWMNKIKLPEYRHRRHKSGAGFRDRPVALRNRFQLPIAEDRLGSIKELHRYHALPRQQAGRHPLRPRALLEGIPEGLHQRPLSETLKTGASGKDPQSKALLLYRPFAWLFEPDPTVLPFRN
ncbi:MAG: hypothetical protein AB9866_09405 [Syntrophobacteraceae bacterium]